MPHTKRRGKQPIKYAAKIGIGPEFPQTSCSIIGRMKILMIDYTANFLRTNILYVAIVIVATTFAVFGVYLLKALKSVTRKMNFLIRFLIYLFVYAF